MANFKELRIVSSIPGQTMNEYCLTPLVPALRLEGKWLEDYTKIGKEYRIMRDLTNKKLIIKFL